MRDNLIIFPATTKYLEEAEVLLRSLLKNMPDVPVHIMSIDGQADSLKKFKNVELIINQEPCDTEFRRIRTSRFQHASSKEVIETFKVVCLLDADMAVIRPMYNIFKMAETGTILVSNNNTMFRYLQKDFLQLKIDAPKDINKIHASFCTVPLICSPSLCEEFLKNVWLSPSGNDLDVPNLLAVKMGLLPRLYYLPSQCFTGIHHSALKPELYVMQTDDGLYSKTCEPVFIIHGHWGDPKYYENQMIEPMIKNYGWHPKYVECARECIKLLKNEYDKYKI